MAMQDIQRSRAFTSLSAALHMQPIRPMNRQAGMASSPAIASVMISTPLHSEDRMRCHSPALGRQVTNVLFFSIRTSHLHTACKVVVIHHDVISAGFQMKCCVEFAVGADFWEKHLAV